MKNTYLLLFLAIVISFSFSSTPKEVNKNVSAEIYFEIQQNISEIDFIIANKIELANVLEAKSTQLNNVAEAKKLIEKANLLRMNCLKYEASKACLNRFMEN